MNPIDPTANSVKRHTTPAILTFSALSGLAICVVATLHAWNEVKGDPRSKVEETEASISQSLGSEHARILQEGRGLREHGDTSMALLRFREAYALNPRDPEAIAEIAVTLEKMGLPERAAENWKRVYDIGESAGVYFAAAEAKMRAAAMGSVPIATSPKVETPPVARRIDARTWNTIKRQCALLTHVNKRTAIARAMTLLDVNPDHSSDRSAWENREEWAVCEWIYYEREQRIHYTLLVCGVTLVASFFGVWITSLLFRRLWYFLLFRIAEFSNAVRGKN